MAKMKITYQFTACIYCTALKMCRTLQLDDDNTNTIDDDDNDIPISIFIHFLHILYALEYKRRLDIVYVLHMSHSHDTHLMLK